MGAPLLRFRSDEQLVDLFRAGHDEAFSAIHDRYHKRLFAYTRQMLHGRQDAEDALQDVFVRAYSGLRATDQHLALRAWLFRVAHNRCVDELRRPGPPPPEVLQLVRSTVQDPLAEVDLRDSLRRLIEDIRRLPEQQRSALLLRELIGMSYADLADSLGISVGAVKSLLVRARVALAQAAEARDTACCVIREQLVEAHDRGIRPNANARKHMRDCVGCKSFRRELRGISRQLAAISPAVGPLGVLAKLGLGGKAGGGAAGGGGLALLGGGGATAGAGGLAVGINHVATLLVAAAATAGGAAAIQHTISTPGHHSAHVAAKRPRRDADPLYLRSPATGIQAIAGAVEATAATAPKLAATADATTTKSVRIDSQNDPLGGGPVNAPATGAASLTTSTRTKPSGPSSGAAGLQNKSSSTSTSGSCSVPIASSASADTTASPTADSGTASASTSPPAAAGAPVVSSSQTPCPTPSSPTTAATSSTGTGASSTGSQTGGSGTGSSGTSSGASSTSTSGSASSSGAGSPSTSSGGGSASASK